MQCPYCNGTGEIDEEELRSIAKAAALQVMEEVLNSLPVIPEQTKRIGHLYE